MKPDDEGGVPLLMVLKKAVNEKHKAQAVLLVKQKTQSMCPRRSCSQAHVCHHW